MGVTIVHSFIGYDCAGQNLNVTSISLLEVEKCPNYVTERVDDNIEIQVLQEKEMYPIQIYQCIWSRLTTMLHTVEYIVLHQRLKEAMGSIYGNYLRMSAFQ